MNSSAAAGSPRLVEALLRPTAYPHPTGDIELIETHISYVLLTGEHVYKIKKPVALPFLDFRTLENRRWYCEEELRLNRRLAPELYLGVIGISGPASDARIGGMTNPIEYAVHMRQFDQGDRLDNVLRRGALTSDTVSRLGARLARFHATLAPAPPDSSYGDLARVRDNVEDNFDVLGRTGIGALNGERLSALRAWSNDSLVRCASHLHKRKEMGFVRECHGDLHLGNIALVDGSACPFDCLEFSADLRIVDVASEVAFLVMDLSHHGRPDLGLVFLNAWLEQSDDFGALGVLRNFAVYLAVVRSKVAGIRLEQMTSPDGDAWRDMHQYLETAERFAFQPERSILAITHELSGSGKSWLASHIAPRIGAVRIRSDVERKRLHCPEAPPTPGGRTTSFTAWPRPRKPTNVSRHWRLPWPRPDFRWSWMPRSGTTHGDSGSRPSRSG